MLRTNFLLQTQILLTPFNLGRYSITCLGGRHIGKNFDWDLILTEEGLLHTCQLNLLVVCQYILYDWVLHQNKVNSPWFSGEVWFGVLFVEGRMNHDVRAESNFVILINSNISKWVQHTCTQKSQVETLNISCHNRQLYGWKITLWSTFEDKSFKLLTFCHCRFSES